MLGEDTDEQTFKELEEYTEKLKEDKQLPDVFDIFSEKNLINVRATYALDWYSNNDVTPSENANKIDAINGSGAV